MAHEAWKGRLEAYAEGTLRWPLTLLVESHTKRCAACRDELRIRLRFFEQLDRVLFTSDEVVRTATSVVRREATVGKWKERKAHRFSLVLAGAAALLVALASLPIGLNGLFSPGVTVVAASSWSEGIATAVSVDDSQENNDGVFIESSIVSSGTGVAVPFLRH